MKRNDLVWKIAKETYNEEIKAITLIAEFYNQDNCSSADRMTRLLVEKIIDKCEKNGMQPPQIKNPRLDKNMDVWTHATEKAIDELYNRKPEIEPYYVNEWESEDEEK
jgi:hypothetical protein